MYVGMYVIYRRVAYVIDLRREFGILGGENALVCGLDRCIYASYIRYHV
jgi:hypothetical protein